MKVSIWKKAQYLVLLLLIVLITFSSHPLIVDVSRAAGMESGTILSRYIIILFVALFIMCFNIKSMMKPRMVRVCWLFYVFLFLFFCITYIAFDSDAMIEDVRSIGICLAAIMIGWQLRLDETRFKAFLIAYAGMTILVGLIQIMTNIGGFQILDFYMADNKNSLGVMLSSSSTIFFVVGINREKRGFLRLLWFALFFLSIVVLLTIRARAASLATILIIMYILFERFKGRSFLLYFIFGCFVVLALFILLPHVFKEYIYNSFVQHQEDDITSGRMERNIVAIHFLSDHFLIGKLGQSISMKQVHNYLLNRTVEFGIIFVIPIILLYLHLLINSFVRTVRSNNRNTQTVGYFLLLIPFIISMVEPTFPYGPGTATVYNFIVFGLSLRYSYTRNYETSSNIQLSSALSGEYFPTD